MSFWGRLNFGALAAAVLIAANGCSPTDQSQLDDEKEPHFALGKSRINQMDYNGAVEAFQAALDVNPHSAAAHFQLACLYDTKASDPAAAIYHYRQYLKFEPGARNADVIRQRIDSCKQQLAADVLPMPSAPAAQQQLEKLVDQNRQLQQKVDQLQLVVKQWSDYAGQLVARAGAAKNNPPPQGTSPLPDDMTQPAPGANVPVTTAKPAPAKPTPTKTAAARTHTVAAGETLAAIARKHGVSLNALESANSGINPKKLHVGQVLNLPAS